MQTGSELGLRVLPDPACKARRRHGEPHVGVQNHVLDFAGNVSLFDLVLSSMETGALAHGAAFLRVVTADQQRNWQLDDAETLGQIQKSEKQTTQDSRDSH